MPALLSAYEFPPGPFTTLQLALLNSLTAITIGLAVYLTYRSFKRAIWSDVAGWLALAALSIVTVVLARTLTRRSTAPAALAVVTSIYGLVGLFVHSAPRVEGDTRPRPFLMIGLNVLILFFLTLPFIDNPGREAAWRTQCRNNLKNILLALHNYYDAHEVFPVAVSNREIAPRSWRVEILPWLDQKVLRTTYRDDQLWDSPSNQPVAATSAPIWRCPSDDHPINTKGWFLTAYAAATGAHAAFSDADKARPIRDFSDGTSNTLMVLEACGREIVWTEPRDVDSDADPIGINLPGETRATSPGVASSYHQGGVHVGMADGAVRFISQTMDPVVLKALTTIDGGEKLPEF